MDKVILVIGVLSGIGMGIVCEFVVVGVKIMIGVCWIEWLVVLVQDLWVKGGEVWYCVYCVLDVM